MNQSTISYSAHNERLKIRCIWLHIGASFKSFCSFHDMTPREDNFKIFIRIREIHQQLLPPTQTEVAPLTRHYFPRAAFWEASWQAAGLSASLSDPRRTRQPLPFVQSPRITRGSLIDLYTIFLLLLLIVFSGMISCLSDPLLSVFVSDKRPPPT